MKKLKWLLRHHVSGDRVFAMVAAGTLAFMVYALVHGHYAIMSIKMVPCVCP